MKGTCVVFDTFKILILKPLTKCVAPIMIQAYDWFICGKANQNIILRHKTTPVLKNEFFKALEYERLFSLP